MCERDNVDRRYMRSESSCGRDDETIVGLIRDEQKEEEDRVSCFILGETMNATAGFEMDRGGKEFKGLRGWTKIKELTLHR